MDRREFVYTSPRRFVAGTVGQPGERVFYLQAADEATITSVMVEKQQVSALADRIETLLSEIPDSDDGPQLDPDTAPLAMPLECEMRIESITFGWESSTDRLVLEFEGQPDDAPEATAVLVVHLTTSQARAFAHRSHLLVAAGRRACPLCEQPINPSGHICPRANGYHRHALAHD